MSEATTDEQSDFPEGSWIAIGAGAGMVLGAAEGGIGTGAGLVLGAGAGAAYEVVKSRTNHQ
jgi:L-aminopeptidase/D-esterase-like protein